MQRKGTESEAAPPADRAGPLEVVLVGPKGALEGL